MAPARNISKELGRQAHVKSLLISALLAAAVLSQTAAGEATHRLTGLFCNDEEQLDDVLAHIRRNLDPRAAVALTNTETVACNYVDRVEYVVVRPIDIGRTRGLVPLVKYRATLVGVIVGGRLRHLGPPTIIFFVTSYWLNATSVERGT